MILSYIFFPHIFPLYLISSLIPSFIPSSLFPFYFCLSPCLSLAFFFHLNFFPFCMPTPVAPPSPFSDSPLPPSHPHSFLRRDKASFGKFTMSLSFSHVEHAVVAKTYIHGVDLAGQEVCWNGMHRSLYIYPEIPFLLDILRFPLCWAQVKIPWHFVSQFSYYNW